MMLDSIESVGGAESFAVDLVTALDQERFRPTLCVSRWDPDRPRDEILSRLDDAGVEFLGLPRVSRIDLRPWPRLIAEMRRSGTAVLHSHKLGSNIWGSMLGPLARVPVFVAHEHTWSFEGNPMRKLIDRHLIARSADAFVAVSERDRERMRTIEKIPEEKLRFIPNGIPEQRQPDPRRSVRAELGIPAESPVVGVVATLRPQKALEVLIEATIQLKSVVPDVKVLIAGGEWRDGLMDDLRRHAERLGVGEEVIFLGTRHDIPEVISTFDVAALSSDYEGSPIAILEYMAQAKPVVSTRVGGVPDIVVDGETGILVEPRDPRALAAAIASLLADPMRRRDMGQAGRHRRRELFSIEQTAKRVGDLYDELLEASGWPNR